MLSSAGGIIYAIIALSFLIFFHELGHFIAAHIFKVRVEVFSIGFGKKIFKKVWGGTEYCLSAIPLGGYVQMKGQNDLNPNERSGDEDSYNTKAPWQRVIILFAGPLANFILAFFIYMWISFLIAPLAPQIGSFSENSTAKAAGLQVNDTIKSINGAEINIWQDIRKAINESQNELDVIFLRDGELFSVRFAPAIGEEMNMFEEIVPVKLIGVTPSGAQLQGYYIGLKGVKYAWDEVVFASTLTVQSLKKLIIGDVSPKKLGGIIAIVDISADAAKTGLAVFLAIVAIISVNLGILNLLPIPALDGGHIMFTLYEMIFRRAPNEKAFYYMTITGWVFLMSLIVFTIYNDIARIITN
ncbi:MAG: RIP metalloprotease RseP [Campylobacteraceae bacterium]|jgi:regulator of sigma E protease|nr:RIP metalloprotease RseP [Campylobacteraceae bacterium]